ncbi:MAG: hypothetical protein AB7F41_06965 [Methylocystis sp.]|uniref:hypothetical protein n=1 Tax=Methylocystis sp. TaxID=1911079 RepID=UPI003D152BE0
MRMFGFAILLFALGMFSSAAAQGSVAEIVAAHIRTQGYACDSPLSAKRDGRASRPDEQVWLLTCAKARYRVRLVPDMAAFVEQMK